MSRFLRGGSFGSSNGQEPSFIIYDHLHKLADYQARVAPWLRSGEVVFHEDIVAGLENAPSALISMMKGDAIGKRLVQVSRLPCE